MGGLHLVQWCSLPPWVVLGRKQKQAVGSQKQPVLKEARRGAAALPVIKVVSRKNGSDGAHSGVLVLGTQHGS